jgi:transcription-repair coupling factor (superfamily II helicase)
MLTAELLEKLDDIGQRMRRSSKPFGGIQLLLVGDFCQLPPVVKEGVMNFAFQSSRWSTIVPKMIELKTIHRQKDPVFHKILDEAIHELKETEFSDLFPGMKPDKFVRDCVIESDLEVLLPSEYIDSSVERIGLYTELDNIQSENDLAAFTERLIDRFGPVPKQAFDLLNTIRLRWIARELGFEKLVLRNKSLIAYFIADQSSTYFQTNQFMQILKFAQANQNRCKLKETTEKLMLMVKEVPTVNSALDYLRKMKEFEETGNSWS